ncbi:hypothetical protein BOTBODRAFT_54054 [Botryobasidium botryosum FD-172 SS1]|uniref:Protein kinase domain-containing protein n=1 Tax=Botryobasidium botryosum (strain FD-172 SS1) TaxID=930990 RepID=A0A067MKZ2_BOTB1|nr:hypothetical protein BOTBODRAFT_54054 [Botryobasidium botryosum FD-172 SS1]
MFAAATSAATAFFKTSSISQNYVLRSSQNGAGSSSTASPSTPSPEAIQSFPAGPWNVSEAVHKITQKRVSVWSIEKRGQAMDKIPPQTRDTVVESLKTEVAALAKMRHPCILEIVEPLEETRSEITFATEPIMSTLLLAVNATPRSPGYVELDEIEIQKGILQLTKGLAFLHTSARLVHSNLTPNTIIINAAGDWKISGLGLTIPLVSADGTSTKDMWDAHDNRLPSFIQRAYDYLAPEYILDHQINVSSDMYSLGCVIYAVHSKGNPPYRNHNNLSSVRSNFGRLEGGRGISGMDTWDSDLRDLVNSLVTRSTITRLTTESLPAHPFFSSLAISTLNFLERSTFASKTREEKIAFMKGLNSVLGRFSEGMRRRKVLPSLLEEMKDPGLLPSILPNVFTIAASFDAASFQSLVLPSLKPLFSARDPPQNMVVLLDNLKALQEKTSPQVFRKDVLPLVYNALESENPEVQERALKTVPDLCETIDYAEFQGVLFPRVALVFTKTRILSVKVNTLVCFLSMVKTLDQTSLTQKLLATLAVHEAMGQKIEREAVATLVLPQLWQMSVGPLLNIEQFNKFMTVIRSLAERVEREHSQHLRDTQRVEDRSAIASGNGSAIGRTAGGSVDFASLVGNKGMPTGGGGLAGSMIAGSSSGGTSWEDDVWGSILNPDSSQAATPTQNSPSMGAQSPLPYRPSAPPQTQSLPASPQPFNNPRPISVSTNSAARTLGTRALQPVSMTPAFPPPPPPQQRNSSPSLQSLPSRTLAAGAANSFSSLSLSSFPSVQPQQLQAQTRTLSPPIQPQKPNYNISLPSAGSAFPTNSGSFAPAPAPMNLAPQPFFPGSMSGVLTPSASNSSSWGQKKAKEDWGDFDPLG